MTRERGKREASPEDIALFQSAVAGVRRLHTDTLNLRPPRAPMPVRSRTTHASEFAFAEPSALELTEDEHLEFKRNGVQPQQWRRLRRGEYPLEDSLDLHGLTLEAAKALLVDFLLDCTARGIKCVRIVHGKGHRSVGHVPVLKPRIAYWLAHASQVVAYVSAKPADGGTGALYVLLKRHR